MAAGTGERGDDSTRIASAKTRWRILGDVACGAGCGTGDFLWAFAVTAGAGALLNKPDVRIALGAISLVLLLVLAAVFSRAVWKAARGGEMSSPWNIGFWLAVVGSQRSLMATPSFSNSLMLARAVVLGALTWTLVLCVAVRLGEQIFAHPAWQIWTQALTAAVMLYFAAKLALQLFA